VLAPGSLALEEEEAQKDRRAAHVHPRAGRVRAGRRPVRGWWRRLGIWRVTAVLAALMLGGLLFLAGPGSIRVLQVQPGRFTTRLPAWARPCVIDTPPPGQANTLAFCARVRGRVIGFVTKDESGDRERHALVVGEFHVTLVELAAGMRTPSLGSLLTAVGPLQRSGFGLRELIALGTR
jgi:hypothetical protein